MPDLSKEILHSESLSRTDNDIFSVDQRNDQGRIKTTIMHPAKTSRKNGEAFLVAEELTLIKKRKDAEIKGR